MSEFAFWDHPNTPISDMDYFLDRSGQELMGGYSQIVAFNFIHYPSVPTRYELKFVFGPDASSLAVGLIAHYIQDAYSHYVAISEAKFSGRSVTFEVCMYRWEN